MHAQSNASSLWYTSGPERIALVLVAIAALSGAVPLIGWILDVPVLATFGASDYPVWPLTTIGHLCLAIGFAASLFRCRISLLFLAVPLAIADIVLFEELAELFPVHVGRVTAQYPGRPMSNSFLSFALIGAALLLIRRPLPMRIEAANLWASVALCVGLYSAVALVGISASTTPYQFFVAPLPSSIATIALATAILWWQRDGDRIVDLAPHHRESWRHAERQQRTGWRGGVSFHPSGNGGARR